MKGVIALCLKDVVIDKFGLEKWRDIVTHAGHSKDPMILPISDVDEDVVLNLIAATCEVLGLSLEEASDAFGDYWVNVYSQNMYKAYYEGAKSAKEMILKMDEVHIKVTRNIRNSRPPRFEYEWQNENTLLMKYNSHRNLIVLLAGLARGLGKLYNDPLDVSVVNDQAIKIVFPH